VLLAGIEHKRARAASRQWIPLIQYLGVPLDLEPYISAYFGDGAPNFLEWAPEDRRIQRTPQVCDSGTNTS